MSFRDNLQHLRSTRNMTQEQLAMLVGVSRQSVTKWEAERAYPEMDKLRKICEIFGCTIDELVNGDLTSRAPEPGLSVPAGPAQDVCGYDEHMRGLASRVSIGVGLIVMGVACAALLEGVNPGGAFSDPDALGSVAMLALVVAGLALIIPAGVAHSAFTRAHPYIEDFYTDQDRAAADRLFSIGVTMGVALILGGLAVFAVLLEGTVYERLFMTCVAVGVTSIVYASVMRGRINVGEHNDNALEGLSDEEIRHLGHGDPEALIERRRRSTQLGAICGIIMLVATAVGLMLLFGLITPGDGWHLSNQFFWMAWVVGGICCGVVSLVYQLRGWLD